MNELESWLAFYDSQDLIYFPLYGIVNGACRCKAGADCANPGKHPVFKWKDQPKHPVRELDNVGISTDPLVVIDLDLPDITQLDEFPETFTTSTGKGFHLWYKANPTKAIKTFTGWRPHIDIRAVGGLVVAPPSRHISGSQYHHVRGDVIAPVPGNILSELPEKGTRKRAPTYKIESILMETHSLMQPVVDKLVSDMEEHSDGRNQTLFRLACRGFELVAAGVLGVDAIEQLVDAALRTGLGREEVMKTLDSARHTV